MTPGAKIPVVACCHAACVAGGAADVEVEPSDAVILVRTRSTQGGVEAVNVPSLLVDQGARPVRGTSVRISRMHDVSRLDPGEIVPGVGLADECVCHVLHRCRARNVVQSG